MMAGLIECAAMKLWKPLAVLVPLLMCVACSNTRPALDVRLNHLRTIKPEGMDDPMLRGDQQRVLYGAVGINAQSARRGEYYTVFWHDASGNGPVEVVFEYQQASTGSKIKKGVRTFPAGETSGKAEFDIIGDDYLKGGRVLDYRCKLLRDGREVASKRSYLWQ
jgi:hypothetical protein